MFLWPAACSKPAASAGPSFKPSVFTRFSILLAIFTFPVDTITVKAPQISLLVHDPEAGARHHQGENIPGESINQMVVVKGDDRQAADRMIRRAASDLS